MVCKFSFHCRYTQPAVERFEIDFFVDGLPLYKSSRTLFWPILMGIHNLPNAPVMTVAIFCGESKPLYAEEYSGQFVDEMNELQRVGIWIGKRHYTVHLRSIIADSLARAFIKGVKSHNAYSACMKCTIITERDGNRVYFPYGAPCESRLHGLHGADKYPDHKIHMTPLVRLHKCDIICDIVVAEAMHLFYKGVMCKLLILWTEGFRDLGCKMTRRQQRELSAHLRSLKLPSDFQRKLRELQYVKLWKASEFKMLLLVAGFVVLKGRINNVAYHFMLLFVAVTLLSTSYHRAK
uniref:uncharacterized protein LOC120953335 isoform X1 n=1 Tax=Anopheles coluzzii TaxID=1518534 RepID=UPI0020FF826A|nr:uncharacterized protein LOC120953335 isoform X1 [Anopheles coluzzii]